MINFDYASLRLIGLTPAISQQLLTLALKFEDSIGIQIARITEIHRDRLVLHNGTTELTARITPRFLQELGYEARHLAVGDWGLAHHAIDGELAIVACMPAMTQLTRRKQGGDIQALASNIDTAIIVMGLDHDFNLRRLERYVALVLAAGVDPLVILTKADLHIDAEDRRKEVEQRLSSNIPIFAVNGLSSSNSELLSAWMGIGQTLVLLGSSGAGKSTLTNTLALTKQITGNVRASDQRGRHTTTARTLHQCPSGACIIDTPGLRSLQLNLDEDSLDTGFVDIASLSLKCQFRDCSHQTEPGCAVRGAVNADRLKNYQKLQREIRRTEQTALDKIAERAKWKVLIKSMKQKKQSRYN